MASVHCFNSSFVAWNHSYSAIATESTC